MRPIILLSLLTACTEVVPPAAPTTAPASAPTRLVQVRSATDRTIFEAPATTVPSPETSAELNAPYPATVRQILVSPGDQVKAGDPLARLSVPELNRAAAELSAAESQLGLVQARRDALVALKAEGLVRQEQLYELERSVAELKARRDQARVILSAQGLGGGEIQSLLERAVYVLRAPIAGTVAESHLVLGAYVEPGQGPLLKIQGKGAARIEALLTQPLPAETKLVFVDLSGVSHPVEAQPLGRVTSAETGSYRTWLALSEPGPLAGGLRGTLRVQPAGTGFLEVPSTALVLRGGHASVYRMEGEALVAVEVVVLSSSGATAVVQGPLKEGDRVLADGSMAPTDGES